MTNYPIPSNARGTNPYAVQEILTAAPSALVARLYETAIRELRRAVACIETKDVKGRYQANRRAYDVIEHLLCTVNEEKGGEIARNLIQLYRFMLRRLINVDLQNDPKAAQDVITLLEPLYQSWRKLDHQLAAQKAPPARAPGAIGESIKSVA